jgi:hypothetical protein
MASHLPPDKEGSDNPDYGGNVKTKAGMNNMKGEAQVHAEREEIFQAGKNSDEKLGENHPGQRAQKTNEDYHANPILTFHRHPFDILCPKNTPAVQSPQTPCPARRQGRTIQ